MADVAGMQHTVGETLFSIGQIPRSEPGFLLMEQNSDHLRNDGDDPCS
jgi:hypothetical protein